MIIGVIVTELRGEQWKRKACKSHHISPKKEKKLEGDKVGGVKGKSKFMNYWKMIRWRNAF